ncbi:hypothetical protein [Nannocystis pusilla]|uniref:hypothetical protein n=1 Tax=Nannocystis pusilla TaxID=889268 RepID=UPI003B7B1F9A
MEGLLYDDDASEAAWELVADLDFGERLALWAECRQAALSSPRVRALCQRLLAIAREGLDRADIRDHRGRTEAFFLDSLEALVNAGTSPADVARAQLGPRPGRDVEGRRAFVRAFHFAGAGLEET